jgi:hypothetical protein
LKGDFEAFSKATRFYCFVLIFIWYLYWMIVWVIIYYLSRWIIGSFVWKEPSLSEKQEISF